VQEKFKKAFGDDDEEEQKRRKKKILEGTTKKDAPPWAILCENVCNTLVAADEEYEELKKKGLKF
jgi:hypothetical protein